MRSKLLIMSTAALLAGTMWAAGQEMQRHEPAGAGQGNGAQAPGQLQDQPKGRPQGGRQIQGQGQMPGQGSPNQTQRNVPHPTTTGQAPRGDEDRDRSQSKDQPDRDRNHVQGRGQPDQDLGRTQGQSDRSQGQNDQDRIQGQNGRDRDRERTQGEAERPSTGSGGAVNLTTEQRTKIRQTVLAGNNAPRADKVTFSVNVGTVVPRTVRVVEVPETLVEIHPEWRGFRYFVYNDEIIIVEPDTLKIVAIVTV